MQKLEEIKNLLIAAKIRTLPDDYFKLIRENSRIDKHDLKFGGDSRFSVFRTDIVLTCYTGSYGSSACGTFRTIDSKLAGEALDYYLNKNMRAVLAGMADYLDVKAAKLVGQAEKELADQQAILDSIKQPEQETSK